MRELLSAPTAFYYTWHPKTLASVNQIGIPSLGSGHGCGHALGHTLIR